jgi:hypothetical protein
MFEFLADDALPQCSLGVIGELGPSYSYGAICN